MDNHAMIKPSAKITIDDIVLSIEVLTTNLGSHNFIVFMTFSLKSPQTKARGVIKRLNNYCWTMIST